MKLATYLGPGGPRVGAAVGSGDAFLDLLDAHTALDSGGEAPFGSMLQLIEAGERGLDRARWLLERGADRLPLLRREAVRLLAPVPTPVQMRDALCFELHCIQGFTRARELRASRSPDPQAAMRDMEARGVLSVPSEFYEIPVYYKCNRLAVCAPDEDVVWPTYSKVMDYELEFGVFIGRKGVNIARDGALDHVFGYTIFNDFSARDAQFLEQGGGLGPAKGKDFDKANAMGPWIVTADEIGDPYGLEMVVRVNGEERGRGNTGSMHWRFEDVIARVSQGETLHPGEFIGSGTVGNGCGLESLRFLDDGDVVELEVERIGVLRNRVVRARAAA